ncbi:MAG: glyoxylate reductase [Gaiellales bacterium]|nr:glyoxylate reductase [Gaiellales bacterium]
MADVLYIVQQGNVEPWLTDFREAAAGRFDLALLDHDAELAPQFAGVRVVVDQGGHATREMIDMGAAAGVLLWQVIGTGLDHTEVDYILGSGIRLANTPGQFSAVALAEHALLFILGLAKRLPEAAANTRRGVMYLPVSDELEGQVLGIVGLGASGRELAKRARALGMRIQAVDVVPVPEEQLAGLGVEKFATLEGLDALMSTSDVVSLHVPLTHDTRHLIDDRRLRLMRPEAVLVNVARGRIVDEDALAEVLRSGVLRGAGIDVFGEEPLTAANPLLQLPNVITTPHTAGVTRGTSRRRSGAAIENAVRMLAGEEPLFQIAGPA